MATVITTEQEKNRDQWVSKILAYSTSFSSSSAATAKALHAEIQSANALDSLLGHLRFCGTIPEEIPHDSSAEKAYSKYTDAVVSEALSFSGLKSIVLEARGNSADVEGVSTKPFYDFVADAKAFRLTRTAKNQKDFKLAALDNWKKGKNYGFIVSPSYHLPTRSSQIYSQISGHNVSVLTFTHLAALVAYSKTPNSDVPSLLKKMLDVPQTLNPSNEALPYWQSLNTLMLSDEALKSVWLEEKKATIESLEYLKQEGINFYSRERSRILAMSHEEAIRSMIQSSGIDTKEKRLRDFRMNPTILD